MIHADGRVETDDMCLATVLACNGYNPGMKRVDGKCVWIVVADEADDFAHELLEEYASGSCRVEPRRFMREVTAIRREMYNFLNKPFSRIVREA